MSNLPSVNQHIQTESVQSTGPVSESSLQAIGSAVNYALDGLLSANSGIAAANASIAALNRIKYVGGATVGVHSITNSSNLFWLVNASADTVMILTTTQSGGKGVGSAGSFILFAGDSLTAAIGIITAKYLVFDSVSGSP